MDPTSSNKKKQRHFSFTFNKIIAYKEIIEDYVTEERSLLPFVINTYNTRPKDIYIIVYLMNNYFNYSLNVKQTLKEIESECMMINSYKKKSLCKYPRKYKYRSKGVVWNYRKNTIH